VDQSELWNVLRTLTTELGEALGPHGEVVLHDLARPDRSMVAIVNGNITGRHEGDGMASFGLELSRSPEPIRSRLHYRARNKSGKPFGSSSLEPYLLAMDVLADLVKTTDAIEETFTADIGDLITTLVDEAVRERQKPVEAMKRADKQAIVARLDSRGIFQVKGSVEQVAVALRTSRVTVYSYLRDCRARQRQTVL